MMGFMGFLLAVLLGFIGCLGALTTLVACFALVMITVNALSLEEWRQWQKGDYVNGISMIPYLLVVIFAAGILDGIGYLCFLGVQHSGGAPVFIGFYAGIFGGIFVIGNCKYLG